MADLYVDSVTGSNSDNGTTPALAFATVQYAASQIAAGDDLWVRRGHSESPTTAIGVRAGASYADLTRFTGWPRGTLTGTATFTHGSTTVSSVNFTTVREAHCGRYIRNDADGRIYLITYIPSTSSFIIDRPYVGSTVSSSAFTISADEDYASRPSAGQTPWDGDAHTLSKLDFSTNSVEHGFNMTCGLHYNRVHGFDIVSGTSSAYAAENARFHALSGCLIHTTYDNYAVDGGTALFMDRLIISGNNTGNSQTGVSVSANAEIYNSAIYGMGVTGVHSADKCYLHNVNIGVEVANSGADIETGGCRRINNITGYDVKLGGTNGYVDNIGRQTDIYIENYGKILGNHYSRNSIGEKKKVIAGVGTPIPDQRASGATALMEVLPNGVMTEMQYLNTLTLAPVFEHEFDVDADSHSYRYYVQTTISGGLTSANFFIEAEYCDQYDSTSEYHITKVKSDEAVSARSGIADWSQYIEITGLQLATAGKLRIRCYCNKYDSTNKIWIDPKVVIS
jgi:hypothetical protein